MEGATQSNTCFLKAHMGGWMENWIIEEKEEKRGDVLESCFCYPDGTVKWVVSFSFCY